MLSQKVVLEIQPLLIVIGLEEDLLVLGGDGDPLLLREPRQGGHSLTSLAGHQVTPPGPAARHVCGPEPRSRSVHDAAEHPGPGAGTQAGGVAAGGVAAGGGLPDPVVQMCRVLSDVLTASSFCHVREVNFLF